MTAIPDFQAAFRARAPLFGPFVRLPGHIPAELLASVGFGCVCVDMEHAPLTRMDADLLVSTFQSHGTPVIIRPRAATPEHILAALDAGAAGLMAPHINTGDQAQALVDAATYQHGRGYAGATRPAGYGARTMADMVARQPRLVIAQVEHTDAVANIDDILSVESIDCIFIGRSDLTLSAGVTDPDAPEVREMLEHVTCKSIEAGRVVGTFTANLDELPSLREQGISFFLLGSDYSMLTAGGRAFKTRVESKLN